MVSEAMMIASLGVKKLCPVPEIPVVDGQKSMSTIHANQILDNEVI
jgi:hypothetical protein